MALDLHSLVNDLNDALIGDLVIEVLVEEAGEVGVHALVSGDQFVGEGQAGHEASFLDPEDGAEASREEDAFDSGESNEAFSEAVGGLDPLEGPVSLHLDALNVLNGLEEELFL